METNEMFEGILQEINKVKEDGIIPNAILLRESLYNKIMTNNLHAVRQDDRDNFLLFGCTLIAVTEYTNPPIQIGRVR